MLNQDHTVREFEFALQRLVGALGGAALGNALGIKRGYLNRMANPNDQETHFRARDLIPVMRLGLDVLDRDTALAPLMILARAAGQALYPVMPFPRPADVLGSLSLTARHWGRLGECSIAALDPHSEGGRRVTGHELLVVEESGHNLISHTAAVVSAFRALHQGGVIRA